MTSEQRIDFSSDRFFGMPTHPEITPDAEIISLASEFRDDVELAWSKESAHPESQDISGRFSPEGQCAVTMYLFMDELKRHWPDLEADNMIGSVLDANGNALTNNHVWTEIPTSDNRTLIVDLTPDQTEGLGVDAPPKIVGFADELAEQGYVYVADRVDTTPESNPSLLPRYEMLRTRYEHTQRNHEFYRELSTQNIFIVGGVASGKTELSKNLEKALPHMHAIDVGNLFRAASKAILEEAEASPHFIDTDLLASVQAGDMQSIDTFVGLLSRKTSLLRKTFSSLDYVKENGTNALAQDGKVIEQDLAEQSIESLVPHVAQAPNVRRAVWDWINKQAGSKGGIILTGHSLVDIDTNAYTVVRLEADNSIAAQRMLQRVSESHITPEHAEISVITRNQRDGLAVTEGILDYLGIEAIDTTNLDEHDVAFIALRRIVSQTHHSVDRTQLQREVGLSREDFSWDVNGLVAGIRTAGGEIFTSVVDEEFERDPSLRLTEFDLSVQTMIQLCGHDPAEVWIGNPSLVADITSKLEAGNATAANEMLSDALQSGELQLNEALVREAANSQVSRIKNFAIKLNETLDVPDFSNPEASPFDHPNAEVSSKNREITTLPNGQREVRIHERHSGKTVVLKRVDRDVSTAYAEGLHYLHAARTDEYQGFGAYVDGEEFPFAWVSYSPVDRAYKKEMLQHFDVEPHRVLEMTRAWNASWSPKNTMSLLFSYAHSELQQEFQQATDNRERDKPLAGIITAINPNLGFRANAFNGVDFGVIGLKPAGFTYILDENGKASYMPRRAIARTLGITEAELETHPRFTRNRIPLMPTNEMAVLFKGTSRYQIQEPLYKIPDDAYKTIA